MIVHDVTIIGAGPAGSVAALLLARLGRSVTLIEQHRFPRDKVCGECLSALGVEVLSRIGLLPRLHSLGALSLTQAIIHGPGRSVTVPLSSSMLGISRHALDSLLLAEARYAGVKVLQPARCEGIESDGQQVRARIRDLTSNTIETLTCSFAMVADGKSALPFASPALTGDIGIKTHWTHVNAPRHSIELFGLSNCYGGLAPIESNCWNTAFSVPAGRLREHRGNINSLFAELLGESSAMRSRLSDATRVSDWLAAPLPRFAVRRVWKPRVIPLGNAAAALEPIGGEGMGLALRSAELAVAALAGSHANWTPHDAHALRRSYARLWRSRRLACRSAAIVVSSPSAVDAAISCLSRSVPLARMGLKAMGK